MIKLTLVTEALEHLLNLLVLELWQLQRSIAFIQ